MDMVMLHFLVTFVAFVDILRKLCYMNPNYAPTVYSAVGIVNEEPRAMPQLGWIVLMVGLMYVYFACKLDRSNPMLRGTRSYSFLPQWRQKRAMPG
jgi:hypothetical protein